MRGDGIERAVVFPGQGTVSGEITGVARDAALDYGGDEALPYQLVVFAGSVDLLYRLSEAGILADVVAGHSLGEYAAAHAAGPSPPSACTRPDCRSTT